MSASDCPADLTRRGFVARSAVALGAVAVPAMLEGGEGRRAAVRVGLVGAGKRGQQLAGILAGIEGAQLRAIADLSDEAANKAAAAVRERGGAEPELYTRAKGGYAAMLERAPIDAVLIATPTKFHCTMAIEAVKAGKHVGSEVPAGFELAELQALVAAKEASGKRYLLLENYLFQRQVLAVLEMARAGIFGETYYAECGYVHDCRFMLFKPDGSLDWWGEWAAKHFGSDYPTHALGPVCKWLGIHEGDRLERCVAQMSRPRVLKRYAARRFGADSAQGKIDWALGDFVATLIETAQGRLIRLDYDVNSPRPALQNYLLQGTQGVYDSRAGVYVEGDKGEAARWEPFETYQSRFEHPLWKREAERGQSAGHGGGDVLILRHFVDMVRENREPWIDVYDAAAWSALFSASRASIEKKGEPVALPDFTGGRWKSAEWRKESLRPA